MYTMKDILCKDILYTGKYEDTALVDNVEKYFKSWLPFKQNNLFFLIYYSPKIKDKGWGFTNPVFKKIQVDDKIVWGLGEWFLSFNWSFVCLYYTLPAQNEISCRFK